MRRPLALAAFLLVIAVLTLPQSRGDTEPADATGVAFERVVIAEASGDVKVVGDVDADGLADLVLGGMEDGLTWWRWPDLRATAIAQPGTEFTTDGALGDIDGDGDLDVVVPDGPFGDNLVWFANPLPGFDATHGDRWQRRTIGAVGDWGKDVELADFDGDGRVDVATRSHEAAMIFFQEADGRWRRDPLDSAALGSEGMASGDIDGDGDADLVLQGVWLENPGAGAARTPAAWRSHAIGAFASSFKAVIADLDGDGRADVLTSSSESTADIAWFRAEARPDGVWTRRVIEAEVSGAHTLQAADFDGDGDADVLVGQMHTTRERTLAIYYNLDGAATRWQAQAIDDTGLHNGVAADIGTDGDIDIFGSNWLGNPPLRLWLNRLDRRAALRIDRWRHHAVTEAHVRSFGLDFADIDGDGRTDIVSGPFWYRQPADPWAGAWPQMELGAGLDAVLAPDLDGDGRPEIVAQRGAGDRLEIVLLTQGMDRQLTIGSVPAASHALGSQGHAVARILPGPTPQLILSSGAGVYYLRPPARPLHDPWTAVRICRDASDEGIALADIDADGRLDLVATTGADAQVAWWRNPGDGTPDWERQAIGAIPDAVFPDRVVAADFDGDGSVDVVVTEENGMDRGAEAYLWRRRTPDPAWQRQPITSRGTLNSLSAADMDADGDPDIVLAEHRGARRLSIWNNLGGGRFVEQTVGAGNESHLGARSVDLDGDGDLDLVSIGWDAPERIHVWRNDAVRPGGY